MDKLKMHTPDRTKDNYERLSELFPNALTETIVDGEVVRAIDVDVLRQEISAEVVEGQEERYQFTWPDKKKAILLANSPVAATLRPCRGESENFDSTENLYIEGDNLDVLRLLQETYLDKVKMIYIDPPYNTGKNYIYQNDFVQKTKDYLISSSQFDDEGNRLVLNIESNGRFHTDWLNMIYTRLKVAKNLLSDDGVLVCAIDENEQPTLSLILKEIFREGGYEHVCVSVVHNPRGIQGLNFSYTHEYAIFVYPKGKKVISDRIIEEADVDWTQFRNWGTESKRTDAKNCFYPVIVSNGQIAGFGDVCKDNFHPSQTEWYGEIAHVYPIDRNGVERKWRYARQSVHNIANMLRARQTEYGYEIEIGKRFGTFRTIWAEKRYDANEYGTKIVNALVPNSGFSFPKSLWTVYDAVLAATLSNPDSIVLDFFSGSATTAHAVMQLNAEDGGKRKFIMVQLPEPCDEKSEAYKTGYKNICEIGKERIRRAGKKIKEESPLTTADLDTGFRVLKLDSSNMKDVYYTPDKYDNSLFDQTADNIKEDRTPEDLLFQVMLDLGILLSSKIEQREIGGKQVFFVNDNYLVACFDSDISDDVVKEIAQYKPYYAVFRDRSFASDSVAVNFEQIFATYSPSTVRRVL